jgi:hypothetical protein
MKWLTTAPVAIALAVSLAACGSGSAQPSGSPTDALAGSDQQTLDKYTTADVTPMDKIDKSKLGLITDGTLRVGTLSDAPPNIFIDPSGKFTGYDNELLRAIGDKLGLKVEFASTGFLRPAVPGGEQAVRRRILLDLHHGRASQDRRLHQRLRLRLHGCGDQERFQGQGLRRPQGRPASAWSRAPSRTTTSPTP